MHPWEIHPALIHFPIAFLLGGLLVDLIARIRPRESLTRIASGLLVAGVISGILAAAAGAISYYTVPAHTEAAHEQMDAHLVLASLALGLFGLVAIARWRRRTQPASLVALSGGLMGSALLISAALLGGKTVYQGGAGVDPQILAPAIVQGHHHHHDGADDGDDDHDHAHAEAPAAPPMAHDHGAPHEHHQHAHGRHPQHAPLFDPDADLGR
jgi:uncharacterized membrane protein